MQAYPARKKLFVTLSIVCDLAILGFFKYFNFGLDNYNATMAALGIPEAQYLGFFRVVLPLGISFYTFQSMSYVIDVYRGDAKVVTNFIDYACYVSMFPQLVAGPIIRFQENAAAGNAARANRSENHAEDQQKDLGRFQRKAEKIGGQHGENRQVKTDPVHIHGRAERKGEPGKFLADMHFFLGRPKRNRQRSRALGGTGLGLAIVKHIAQLHGGKAELDSESGKGCCFKIVLPENNSFHRV